MVNIMLSGFIVTITTMGPSTTILRKTPDDGNCEGMGRGTVLRGENLLSEVLSCGLAGRPVTYCHCSSSGASNTTILPGTLIVNAESTPSSTSDGLSLIVDVNDCAGMEQLRIRVSVYGSSIADTLEMVGNYSRRSSFTFSLLSPENYICHVAIVGDNGVLESRNVSCNIPPPPPAADPKSCAAIPVGSIVGSTVGSITVVTVFIIIISSVSVIYWRKKGNKSSQDPNHPPLQKSQLGIQPPSAYEEMGLPKDRSFELEKNVAYGHVQK